MAAPAAPGVYPDLVCRITSSDFNNEIMGDGDDTSDSSSEHITVSVYVPENGPNALEGDAPVFGFPTQEFEVHLWDGASIEENIARLDAEIRRVYRDHIGLMITAMQGFAVEHAEELAAIEPPLGEAPNPLLDEHMTTVVRVPVPESELPPHHISAASDRPLDATDERVREYVAGVLATPERRFNNVRLWFRRDIADILTPDYL